LLSAMDEVNQSMRVDPAATKARLHAAGFVDVSEQVVKFPWSGWHHDPVLKETGLWFLYGMKNGIDAMTLAPLTRIRRWSVEEVRRLVDGVKDELRRQSYHGYFQGYVWTARRP